MILQRGKATFATDAGVWVKEIQHLLFLFFTLAGLLAAVKPCGTDEIETRCEHLQLLAFHTRQFFSPKFLAIGKNLQLTLISPAPGLLNNLGRFQK